MCTINGNAMLMSQQGSPWLENSRGELSRVSLVASGFSALSFSNVRIFHLHSFSLFATPIITYLDLIHFLA